ncbi:MAG: hypothetical protein KKB20_25940 [Proteobacteria bacterium]|nr:hypothetical protein [Pseudomonadota bacterium]
MKKLLASITLLTLLAAGCAVAPPAPTGPIMIPGHMFSLKDGTEFTFAIERSSGTGIMTARNLATGEEFTGNYTAMLVNGGVSTGTYKNAWGTDTGTVTTNTAATRGVGKGILRGNKGTVISISMDIKPSYDPRINPSGFGEGTDNHDLKYQVQFGGN